MTGTLASKVIEGIRSQSWEVIGRDGTWAEAMRPLEIYIQRKVERAVKAEREACAKVCEEGVDTEHPTVKGHIMKDFGKSSLLAAAIRARGEKK